MKAHILNLLTPAALAYILIASTADAQTQKSVKKTIIVTNGDTTINGKRVAEMDKKERESIHKEFSQREKDIIEEEIDAIINKRKQGEILVRKFRNGSAPFDIWLNKFEDDSMKLSADSITWKFRHQIPVEDVLIASGDAPRLPRFRDRLLIRDDAERLNSQNFHFRNTDKQGFVTEVNIGVLDADKEQLKKITGKERIDASLITEDFTLFPNFSSGKTGVSFSIPTKGALNVVVTDSDNKTIFTDKVNGFSGTYLKSLNLSKNGVYHIALSQNGKWFVKKIVKV